MTLQDQYDEIHYKTDLHITLSLALDASALALTLVLQYAPDRVEAAHHFVNVWRNTALQRELHLIEVNRRDYLSKGLDPALVREAVSKLINKKADGILKALLVQPAPDKEGEK